MANAKHGLLEFRAVIRPGWTELYVRFGPDNEGGALVGGWRKKIIPVDVPALDAMTKAILAQEYLLWDRGAPVFG